MNKHDDPFRSPEVYAEAYRGWMRDAMETMRTCEREVEEGERAQLVAAGCIAGVVCMLGLQPDRCQCKNPAHGTTFAKACGGKKAHADERRQMQEALKMSVSLEMRKLVKHALEHNRALNDDGSEGQIAVFGAHALFLSRLIPTEG